jgi:two-component system, LuxR family, response regulator FixJ
MNIDSTVFIVDDDQAVRRSLEMLLTASGMCVKTYASCEEFLAQYDPVQPGCLILDMRLPGMDGMELLSVLSQRERSVPAIIVTGHGDVPMTVEAFKRGAVDFIQKPYREQELLAAIKKAIAKSEADYSRRTHRKDIVDKINRLSSRDRQIIGLLAEGYSDKQIAAQIGITQRAVAHHRLALVDKFGVPNTVKLATLIESLWVTT